MRQVLKTALWALVILIVIGAAACVRDHSEDGV